MEQIQEDFLDILEKQRGLVALAIKVTQGKGYVGKDEEDEDSVYWDHNDAITMKQHGKWSRTDEEYQTRLAFIDELNMDIFERDIMRHSATNPAIAGNISKTKLSKRGYSIDGSGDINVGEVFVGFGTPDGEILKKEDIMASLMEFVPVTEEI